jgi:prepilin-type N-terminal cleavage/methylation domain-containing protein
MRRAGFSLLELLVAIGIIALLATITTVVARNVVEGMNDRNTKGTINLLVVALQEYKDTMSRGVQFVYPPDPFWFADPVNGGAMDKDSGIPIGGGGSGNPSNLSYFYDSFSFRWGYDSASDMFSNMSPAIFTNVTDKHLSPSHDWEHWDSLNNVDQAMILGARASTEVLYTYLDDVPKSRAILDRIPEDAKRNDDKDSVDFGGGRKNLVEIIDAWKTPLRYQNQGVGNFPLITSAGKDGVFDTDDDIRSDQL